MPYKRARELYSQRRYREALLEAQNQLKSTNRPSSSYQDLVDEICMHSAATGEVIGFDGRILQVLPANPETAWLGLHAEVPPQGSQHTYCSIADAVEAAADGDVIQLLPGTHIVSQVSLSINKRLLIEGTATSAGQVVLDHRANHPAFTISRSCILNNFTIDMVGFCEAVSVTGSSITVKPVLRGLHVSCSGDDGFSVGGKSQPLMQNCHVQVRKCGIKQYDSSSLTLWQFSFTNCQHAIMTAGTAQCFLEGCHILDCTEDGIIGLERSSIHLTCSYVTGCKGPGIDLSDKSGARLKASEVKGCCGGVWLWNSATCEAISSHIDGGSSYAVLLDEQAYACGSSCTIDGPCHDSSEAPVPANIKRTSSHLQQTPRTGQAGQQLDTKALNVHKRGLETQSSSAARGSRSQPGVNNPAVAAVPSSSPTAAEPQAKCPKTAAEHLHKQLWQQDEPCSPFSVGSSSGSSLRSCGDVLGFYGSSDGSVVYSQDGSGMSCGLGPQGQAANGGYVAQEKRLVGETMLVADGVAAAALFPPETGAFVYQPSLY